MRSFVNKIRQFFFVWLLAALVDSSMAAPNFGAAIFDLFYLFGLAALHTRGSA